MVTVWIDKDACTGAGTCEQIAPEVFFGLKDGTWAVKEDRQYFGQTIVYDGRNGPGHGSNGSEGQARVPAGLLDLVMDAAEQCPGECIFVED